MQHCKLHTFFPLLTSSPWLSAWTWQQWILILLLSHWSLGGSLKRSGSLCVSLHLGSCPVTSDGWSPLDPKQLAFRKSSGLGSLKHKQPDSGATWISTANLEGAASQKVVSFPILSAFPFLWPAWHLERKAVELFLNNVLSCRTLLCLLLFLLKSIT